MSEFYKVMDEAAPELLKLEVAKHTNAGEYCERLVHRYRGASLLHGFAELAQAIEPFDRSLGYNEDEPSANAFLAGSVLGMRIVREFVPTGVQTIMENVLVANDTEDEDWFERMHQLASSIVDSSERGFQLVPNMEPLIEEWAEQAVPEVAYQPFFRRGFGVVMYMMHEAYEAYATAQLEIADRDGVDWDAEAQKLFGPETKD